MRVLIVGVQGQDGQWLRESVQKSGASFVGVSRQGLISNVSGWEGQKTDIRQAEQVFQLVREFQPDEIYYLPAVHFSSEEKLPNELDLYAQSYQINVLSLVNFLEAMRLYSKRAKLFYAASSHVFGTPLEPVQDENTPFNPNSIYGISKLSGIHSCRYYRERHGLFSSVGILYNHESTKREAKFLSQKIVQGALRIHRGEAKELVVGDLSAIVDWGYAPDFVEAMRLILSIEKAEDFIIATGIPHTVLDLVRVSFEALDLDYRNYVRQDEGLLQKRHAPLVGNPTKLKRLTGWEPKVSFNAMIKIMLGLSGSEGGK